ncbi:MAG TPA: cytidylate kinase-like family protein [Gemmatimonadales bacterium]|jgi:cytidylate kinase
MLLTISREFGAGGSAVAETVARRLGWRLVDNQLVEEIARRAGMTPEEAQSRVERGPTFIERVARAMAAATPEALTPGNVQPPELEEARIKLITEQVVSDSANEHAVLVGRAAGAVIARRADALHIKLVGTLEYRRQVIADRLGISLEQAERQVRDVDAHRTEYHRRWYQRDWRNPQNYHLVINTGWVGLDRASDLIIDLVTGK